MKKVILFLVFCLSIGINGGMVKAEVQADKIGEQLLNLNKSNTTVMSDFEEVKQMPKLKKTIIKHGKLYFAATDRLAMRYTDPDGDYSIIRDGLFLIKRGGHTQRLKMDGRKTQFQILRNTLLYSMQGQVQEVANENDADIEYTQADGKYICHLTKRGNQRIGVTQLELQYDKQTGALLVLKLIEGNGISTTYSTPKPQLGVKIDDSVWAE